MITETHIPKPKAAVWTGRAMSGMVVLFLIMDSVMKVIDPTIAQQTQKQLSFSAALDRPLGFAALAIVILSALPGTAFSGALLLTGYLGGAVASHLRVGDPVFTDLLFGVYIGLFAWAALRLRSLSRL